MSRMAKKRTPTRLTKKEVLDYFEMLSPSGRQSRLQQLWSVYSLHPPDVWALIKQQKGRCPMCGQLLTLESGSGLGHAIDHEGPPLKGRVRGVLHVRCNQYVLGHLEANYRDLSDKEKTGNIARKYLSNPPAKKVRVGDSNLYDEKIEDRKKRGRPGRPCEREGCEKTISATSRSGTKYCSKECNIAAQAAARRAKIRAPFSGRICANPNCDEKILDDTHGHQKYCGRKCKSAVFRAKKRKAAFSGRICANPNCGEEIPDDANGHQKYCDTKCKTAVSIAKQTAARRARRRKG